VRVLNQRPSQTVLKSSEIPHQLAAVVLKEWKVPTSPEDSIGKNSRYRDHFKIEELGGGKGWVISRVK